MTYTHTLTHTHARVYDAVPFPTFQNTVSPSPRMGHNLTHNIPLLLIIVRADLIWQRHLLGIIVRARHHNQIDARRITRKQTRGRAFLAQVDLRAINLVKQNRGHCSGHLDGKVLRLDHVDRRDERLNEQTKPVGVVNGNGVGLATNDNGALAAFANQNRVRQLSVDLDWLIFVFVVFL